MNNLISKLEYYQNQFGYIKSISNLISIVLLTNEALSTNNFPPTLPRLEIPESTITDVYQDIINQFPDNANHEQILGQATQSLSDLDATLGDFRQYLIQSYGMYGYVSNAFLRDLSAYINQTATLEIMAGNGYITGGLRLLNPELNIIATDNFDWAGQESLPNPITKVIQQDALQAVQQYSATVGIIILSWAPEDDQIDYQILEYLRTSNFFSKGGKFIVIGEKNGVTNSKAFWENAKLTEVPQLNKNHQSFDLIDERVYLAE